MPNISDYQEKFLDAEKKASDLVKQLEVLKNESVNYKNASNSLSEVNETIMDLISNFSGVVSEEENLIKAIREIGTEKIITTIEQNRISFGERIQILERRVSKLFTFIYIIIGLIGITSALVIIFR